MYSPGIYLFLSYQPWQARQSTFLRLNLSFLLLDQGCWLLQGSLQAHTGLLHLLRPRTRFAHLHNKNVKNSVGHIERKAARFHLTSVAAVGRITTCKCSRRSGTRPHEISRARRSHNFLPPEVRHVQLTCLHRVQLFLALLLIPCLIAPDPCRDAPAKYQFLIFFYEPISFSPFSFFPFSSPLSSI